MFSYILPYSPIADVLHEQITGLHWSWNAATPEILGHNM